MVQAREMDLEQLMAEHEQELLQLQSLHKQEQETLANQYSPSQEPYPVSIHTCTQPSQLSSAMPPRLYAHSTIIVGPDQWLIGD